MLRITIVATALAVNGLTACGGGAADTPRNEPVAAPTPAPPQRSPEEVAAIAAVDSLLNSPMTHLTTASATLDWTIYHQVTWSAGNRCGIGGTQQITLDGTPWTGQSNFSAGRHALTARFEGCTFSGPFDDIVLNGSVEMVYEASETRNVSAVLTTKDFYYSLEGVVIEGPASYSIESEQGATRPI